LDHRGRRPVHGPRGRLLGGLRYLNVNVAYAVDALSFVAVAILSRWLLREHVTPIRWLGIVLICIGIGLIVVEA
jgi:drug/metabolite transporter (DMT)-like permease